MKRLLMLIIGISFCYISDAQLAKWVLTPAYDSIYVKVDNRILETDSLGISSLWTMDGKLLFKTEHRISAFKNGVATVVAKDKDIIKGFVDLSGLYTSLPDIGIAYGNPCFNDGFLLSKNGNEYVYYKLDGTKAKMKQAIKSYPFHQGFAPYFSFAQFDRKKDPFYGYHTADGKPVYLRIFSNGTYKEFIKEDLVFLSGIGPDGKGVAVIKDKLYWFNSIDKIFEPMIGKGDESEKKRHLSLSYDYTPFFQNLPYDKIEIRATYGKKKGAVLQFNRELVPVQFIFDDEIIQFKDSIPVPVKYHTDLSTYGNGKMFGLSIGTENVLPEQFEKVGLLYEKKACVKKNGKWGIIEILPDLSARISINKGKDIAFRHHQFETQMRLDLPAVISAKEARLDIPESTGCTIDKTSRETKDTESGNYVLYNCTLDIPSSLPDTITKITYYPISLTYDDILTFDSAVQVRAWHLKYYNVDPIDSETTVENGIASFTININAQRNVGEGDYPFDVKIEADSISVNYEKISETRYKCTVYNLKEGNNNLDIYVTEQGCPSSIFPFEITYTKPVPQKKEKEKVVIRKVSPESKTLTSTPRLEI